MGTPEATGLRERKKQKTRDAIVDAAMRLFEERGFEGTTVADIAAAADIAPRTFFAYFPSKDDVVFWDFEETLAEVKQRLRERQPGETAIDAVRAWIAERVESSDRDPAREACRHRLINETETLRAHDRHLMGYFEAALAEALVEDLGSEPDDIRVPMVAAAAGAALRTITEHKREGLQPGEDPMAVIDQALTFLRGGLAELQRVERRR